MDKELISAQTHLGLGHALFLKEDCGGDVDNSIKSTSPGSSTKSFEDDEFLPSCDNTIGPSFDYTFNIIMIGDSGVGKTDLIGRLCDDDFTTKFFATIGINVESYLLDSDGKKSKLQIWDPSGSDRFRLVVTKYFHNAHGIIFVYDVNYQKSFESIKKWIELINGHPEVDSKVAKILVGNKCDMNRRAVSTSDGENLAMAHEMKFMETSTRTGLNVRQVFSTLCQELMTFKDTQVVPCSAVVAPSKNSPSSAGV